MNNYFLSEKYQHFFAYHTTNELSYHKHEFYSTEKRKEVSICDYFLSHNNP